METVPVDAGTLEAVPAEAGTDGPVMTPLELVPVGSGAVNERWVNANRKSLRSISWFWTACQRSLR